MRTFAILFVLRVLQDDALDAAESPKARESLGLAQKGARKKIGASGVTPGKWEIEQHPQKGLYLPHWRN